MAETSQFDLNEMISQNEEPDTGYPSSNGNAPSNNLRYELENLKNKLTPMNYEDIINEFGKLTNNDIVSNTLKKYKEIVIERAEEEDSFLIPYQERFKKVENEEDRTVLNMYFFYMDQIRKKYLESQTNFNIVNEHGEVLQSLTTNIFDSLSEGYAPFADDINYALCGYLLQGCELRKHLNETYKLKEEKEEKEEGINFIQNIIGGVEWLAIGSMFYSLINNDINPAIYGLSAITGLKTFKGGFLEMIKKRKIKKEEKNLEGKIKKIIEKIKDTDNRDTVHKYESHTGA